MVNKASRITQMAAGGQILMSSELWEYVKNKFDIVQMGGESKGNSKNVGVVCQDMGSFILKGMAERTVLISVVPGI